MILIQYSLISKDNHKWLLDAHLDSFPYNVQKEILAYKRWEDAQSKLLGRLLLINGLKLINKIFCHSKIKYTKYGKPYFEDCNIKFNISHSGNIVICAITDIDDIGIDIEIVSDVCVDDYTAQMTETELSLINNSENSKRAFFEYWTEKEAAIKAHGMGLAIPLNSFEIINNKTNINGDFFYLSKIKIENNYVCHLALKNSIIPLVFELRKISSILFKTDYNGINLS